MVSRAGRLARGGVAAVFATLVALGSHLLGGGILPSPAALALSLTFALLTCVALAGRSLSLLRTTIAVGASQVAFHMLFGSMGLGGATSTGARGMPGMPGMPDHTETLTGLNLTAPLGEATAHSPWMTLAHTIAGILTIVALRHGEAAFWGLRDSAVLALGILLRMPTVVPIELPVVRMDRSRATFPQQRLLLLADDPRRGPPAALVTA